jgi:hypothetical protein
MGLLLAKLAEYMGLIPKVYFFRSIDVVNYGFIRDCKSLFFIELDRTVGDTCKIEIVV